MSTGPRFHDGFAADSIAQSQSLASPFCVPPNSQGGEQSLEATNKNEEKYAKARKAMANFWYFCNIPFNAAKSPYYEAMVKALTVCGAEFKSPEFIPLCDDYIENLLYYCLDDVFNIDNAKHKKIWVRKGCTIMFDEWTDERGRTLINFLVASTSGPLFLKSVDASDKIKTERTLFTFLEDAVLKVKPQNVVQVITNNSAAYVAAGKLLEHRFPTIFWTPYATHCIDHILEDIGKISWIKEVLDNAKEITKFIYNNSWILNLMRQYTDGKEVVQVGVTQFATDFLTLQSLHSRRVGLKMMIGCEEWTESSFSTSKEALVIAKIIFDEDFWKTSYEIIQVSEPLVKVLHIVDNQDKSPMGYLYEAMDKAKDAIARYYKNIEAKYCPFWELIDNRWSSQLHKPIHAAGYYLNPKYFYDEAFVANEEILNGLYICLERMVQDEQKMDDILKELQLYRSAKGSLFSSALCIRSRTTQNPAIWWELFGAKTPLLQQIAIRILSQPCNFSKYEHNQSVFEHTHSKNFNTLLQGRLIHLEELHYNLIFRHNQIDRTDHHALDPTCEWITELETKQPAGGDDWFSSDDFARIESEVAQELTVMEEAQVQVQTSVAATKGKRKKRAHH